MKVLAIITYKKNEKVTLTEPLNKKNTQLIQYTDSREVEINEFFKTFKNKEGFTHVVFLTTADTLSANYFEIIEALDSKIEITSDVKKVYMPIVRWEPEGSFKGFLNSTVWKEAYRPVERGVLDFELAKKQIDSYLGGICFDIEIIKDNPFDTEIKFYSYLNLLNKISKNEKVLVLGVPKVLITTTCDFTLKNENLEEKTKNFKLAQELV